MYSAYKLIKQGDNIQPWCTPFPIWNQSIIPCLVLTVASWPTYRFLRRQVRWSGIPISLRISTVFVMHTFKGTWEKAMAPHSSTLAWRIPWTEEPGRVQSMGSLRVRQDWATSLSLFTFHFHALEKEMATHSSVLAWRIPGMGEPGGLPRSRGSHRVWHDWSDLAAAAAAWSLKDFPVGTTVKKRLNPWIRKIPWRRKWQPTPVFLPGESHQRSLVVYSSKSCKECMLLP